MPWLPPRGLDTLKATAMSRGLWEDLGNGSLTKAPVPKRTSVQAVRESGPADDGTSTWAVTAVDAGPAPVIHYCEDGVASSKSPRLPSGQLVSKALRLSFLAVDPSGRHEAGDPTAVSNTPKLRNRLDMRGGRRFVELFAAPCGDLHYSTDGSEPRNGTAYAEAFEIPNETTTVAVHCDANGIEVRETFVFPAVGGGVVGPVRPVIDQAKPARLSGKRWTFDSRAAALRNIAMSADLDVTFRNIVLIAGDGSNALRLMTMGDVANTAQSLQGVINTLLSAVDEAAPVTFSFQSAEFPTGDALEQFAEECGIELTAGEVHQ
jgi:hypothetical protein